MDGPARAAANAELLFMVLLFLMFSGGGLFALLASRRLNDHHRRQAEDMSGWAGRLTRYFHDGLFGEMNVWAGRIIGAAFIVAAGGMLAMIASKLGLT